MTIRFARTSALAVLFLAGLGLIAGNALAQSWPSVTFDAVSSYSLERSTNGTSSSVLSITGVQHGASAASTSTYTLQSNSTADVTNPGLVCEKQLLVAINRPGRFSVTVKSTAAGAGTLYGCQLTQLP